MYQHGENNLKKNRKKKCFSLEISLWPLSYPIALKWSSVKDADNIAGMTCCCVSMLPSDSSIVFPLLIN